MPGLNGWLLLTLRVSLDCYMGCFMGFAVYLIQYQTSLSTGNTDGQSVFCRFTEQDYSVLCKQKL